MRISDQKLRADRLVFYAQDVSRLDGELDGFLEFSGARCAVLVDKEGHLLGEEAFANMSHQGARQSIQVSMVGERTLLAIVWDERTNLGLVRFYAQETIKRLERIFQDIAARPPSAAPEVGLSDGYSKEATAALDDLF